MIYDGMDADLQGPMGWHANQLGLRKGQNIPYSWLYYAVGRTTAKMLAGGDVLTGYMSGCLITLWSEKGVRYVGHVGTDDDDPPISALVKKTFADYMPSQTTGFDPYNAWSSGEITAMKNKFKREPGPKIFGLVTTGGNFYSILMFKKPQPPADDWCVGGIKPVAPMNRDALFLRLRRLRDK